MHEYTLKYQSEKKYESFKEHVVLLQEDKIVRLLKTIFHKYIMPTYNSDG